MTDGIGYTVKLKMVKIGSNYELKQHTTWPAIQQRRLLLSVAIKLVKHLVQVVSAAADDRAGWEQLRVISDLLNPIQQLGHGVLRVGVHIHAQSLVGCWRNICVYCGRQDLDHLDGSALALLACALSERM